MAIFIGEQNYNILDLGFDKSLIKAGSVLAPDDITPELVNTFIQGVASKSLLAG